MKKLMSVLSLICLAVICFQTSSFSQSMTSTQKSEEGFVVETVELPTGYFNGNIVAFDYNDDAYKDILITGFGTTSGLGQLDLFVNVPSDFIATSHDLLGTGSGSVCVLDYNNDSKLDVFVSGQVMLYPDPVYIVNLYENSGDEFSLVYEFPVMKKTIADWSDINKDGLIDMAISGLSVDGESCYTNIYINNGDGTFDMNQSLSGALSDLKFCDYNNDSYPDLSLMGENTSSVPNTYLYKNVDGVFVEVDAGFQGLQSGDILWKDFNMDGALDLFIFGYATNQDERFSMLYSNDGDDNFSVQETGILGYSRGASCSVDVNNDGLLDILLSGYNSNMLLSGDIYLNEGDFNFIQSQQEIPALSLSDFSVVDFDNDNTPEILITGRHDYMDYKSHIISITPDQTNEAPSVPQNLSYSFVEDGVMFSWDEATDDNSGFLSYNVAIGNASETENLLSSLSYADGSRRYFCDGNAGFVNEFMFKPIESGPIYFKVQAIDCNLTPSSFSEEIWFDFVSLESFSLDACIYPNPVIDVLFINLADMNYDKIYLLDINGREIAEIHENNSSLVSVDFGMLSEGVYLLKVVRGMNSEVYKLIKS